MLGQVLSAPGALAAVLGLALLGAACRDPAPSSSPPAAAPATYALTATVASPVVVATPAALVITLEARGGYHVNPEYPLGFRPEGSSPGVSFAQQRFELKDSTERTACPDRPTETCGARSRVLFTVTTEGPQHVAGVLAFSVCDPERCVIEKVPIAVDLR